MFKSFLLLVIAFVYVGTCYSQDIAKLRQQADMGSSDAQFQVGQWFCSNHSQTDYEVGLKYLRTSARQGNSKAIGLIKELTSPGYEAWGKIDVLSYYNLGELTSEDEKYLLGTNMRGNAGANIILANSYFLKGDYANAVSQYNTALKTLNSEKLGSINYENGESEQMESVYIILDAISHLGYCYEYGLGVPKNLDKAIAYFEFYGGYEETADQNICQIIRDLLSEYNNKTLQEYVGECGGQVYDGLMGIGFDNPLCTRPWRKIGILYLKKHDYARAKEILNDELPHTTENGWISCGSPIEYLWLAEMYYKGLGVPVNYEKAFTFFDIIVNNPILNEYFDPLNLYPELYADACYRLYECYTYGRGVSTDKSRSHKYFKEALKYGSTSALSDSQKRYEIIGE